MSKKKFYFRFNDSDTCYQEDHFQQIMKDENLDAIGVFEAIPAIIGGGVFWCKEHQFCGNDSSYTCGRYNCKQYEPRNGKNGRFRYHSEWLYEYGDKVVLHLKRK